MIQGSEVAAYWESWRKQDTYDWNVGYIRSTEQPELNSYGNRLNDLVGIIRTAPEAKRCLAERMAEYFIGTNQTFDGRWLDDVTRVLTEPAPSTASFKAAIKKIVTSTAFRQQNPDKDECYDFADGVDATDRPPCAVAAIFEDHCISCHNSAYASRGLALDTWIETANGVKGFKHIKSGIQVQSCSTFAAIKDRVATDDPSRRMPMGGDLPAVSRAKLYLWADRQLSACQ